jgi:filamentous hemagglutinin family protein
MSIQLGKKVLTLTAAAGLLWVLGTGRGFGLPVTPTVVAGSASYIVAVPTATINQTSQRAIINWSGPNGGNGAFSVFFGEKLNVNQPSATAALLNRDTSGFASVIDGTITANGQVYLINPVGITIGTTAVISAFSFGASTLDVNDNDFMSGFPTGKAHLFENPAFGTLGSLTVLDGAKITANGGHIVLISDGSGFNGLTIGTNGGGGATIQAPGGYIGLASAEALDIDLVQGHPTVQTQAANTYGNRRFINLVGDGFVDIRDSLITTSGGTHAGQIDIAAPDLITIDTGFFDFGSAITADSTLGNGGSINIFSSVATFGNFIGFFNFAFPLISASSNGLFPNIGQGGSIVINGFSYLDTPLLAALATGTPNGQIVIGVQFSQVPFVVPTGFYNPAPIIVPSILVQ